MNPRMVILLVSLAANLALGSLVLMRSARSQEKAAETIKRDLSSTTPRQYATKPQGSPPASSAASQVEVFSWGQLESEDYTNYIAALRAFGVPERTVRD